MNNNFAIKLLQPNDSKTSQLWDNFVLLSHQATFFHKSGWQHVINSVFGHKTFFLYAFDGVSIKGILPLAHVKSILFGNSLVSLPFAVYGGVVAVNDEICHALEIEATKIAKELDVDHLEYRNIKKNHTDWPTQDLYVTFKKNIFPTEEENLLAIPRKQRAMVRKGIKNGLKSCIDKNVDRFFNLYSDNVHRHGTPAFSKKYFEVLLNTFGSECEVLTVTTADNKPLSSVFSFYFRDEVLPYYAGDHPLARETAANDFKYWELLRRACELDLKVFDFGRSKLNTGSYSFKKNWGFDPTPLSYEYCLFKRMSIPQNNPSNKKYKLLIAMWKLMPIAVANKLGPFLVKSLG